MKTKGIVLTLLLVCAIGLTALLYSISAQENVTEQQAYAIGEAILKETIIKFNPDALNPVIRIEDKGRVWRVYEEDEEKEEDEDSSSAFFVEISKRTGKVVRVRDSYLNWNHWTYKRYGRD